MSNKTKIQGHNTALESLKNILAVPMEKHGMYVWRKSEFSATVNRTVTNPSYNTSLNTNTFVLTITLTGITILQQDLNDFLVGFTLYSPAGNNAGTVKYSGEQLILDVGARVINAIATISGQTITVTFSGSFTWVGYSGQAYAKYAGDKAYKEYNVIGGFLDFVVSDIESAYPGGGLKDGYWYEKVKVGTYKTTSGSITLTEASQSIEIGHGLSETPKAYLITMTSQPSTTTSTNFSAYPFNYEGTTAQDVTLVGNGSAFRRTDNTIDDKTITIKSYNSQHSFQAGTYDWMAMA